MLEPRAAGIRTAIRILLASRSLLDHQRTANCNALTALLRGADLGIDARASLRDAQITAIAAWRSSNSTDPVIRVARAEAKRLALAIKDFTGQLAENHKALAQLTEELAPGLQTTPGVGPVTAAIIICAYSHHGRIRSEAAFAALGGVAHLRGARKRILCRAPTGLMAFGLLLYQLRALPERRAAHSCLRPKSTKAGQSPGAGEGCLRPVTPVVLTGRRRPASDGFRRALGCRAGRRPQQGRG
ncbi:hypothetical protein DQ354_19535 [Arthrobacter sp. AQ5-06]|nr:hypothetical protein DQ354_19535 [Arthrobacter sp. AQ5-06]